MDVTESLRTVGTAMDAFGVVVVVVGATIVSVGAVMRWARREAGVYRWYRQQLGRSILLGLELMVAGDIIRSATDPTLPGVIVLGGIVLIRTILSFSLEVEISGHWPWNRGWGRTADVNPPHEP